MTSDTQAPGLTVGDKVFRVGRAFDGPARIPDPVLCVATVARVTPKFYYLTFDSSASQLAFGYSTRWERAMLDQWPRTAADAWSEALLAARVSMEKAAHWLVCVKQASKA